MSIKRMRDNFGQHMKFGLIIIAAVFVLSAIFITGMGPNGNDQKKQAESGKSAIATINGQKIERQTYNAIFARMTEQSKETGTVSVVQMAQQKGAVLDQLIDEQLKLQAASQEGMKISKKQVRGKIDSIVDEQIKAYRANVTGKKKMTDKEVNKVLAGLSQPTSLKKLRGEVRKSLDPNAVRAQLMVEELDKILDTRFKQVSDKEFMDSLLKLHARHILIGTASLPEEQANRRAEEVLRKIKAGGNFVTLAKEFSDDPGSKNKGGDLGYFGAGMMVPEFEKAAFALKPGQTSGLVKTDYGYHIIQVMDSKVELPNDFEKNKKKLKNEFAQNRMYSKKSEYYENLRLKSKIKVNDPELQGYTALMAAFRSKSKAERDKKMVEAMRAYERATTADISNTTAWVVLAQIHEIRGQKAEAKKIYENLLEGKAPIEDPDLRMQLGQIYLQEKQKDKAIEQFQIASDISHVFPRTILQLQSMYSRLQMHYQLQNMFKQLGRMDLAANEEQYINDFSRRAQELQSEMMPPTPEPAKPEKNKAGG